MHNISLEISIHSEGIRRENVNIGIILQLEHYSMKIFFKNAHLGIFSHPFHREKILLDIFFSMSKKTEMSPKQKTATHTLCIQYIVL